MRTILSTLSPTFPLVFRVIPIRVRSNRGTQLARRLLALSRRLRRHLSRLVCSSYSRGPWTHPIILPPLPLRDPLCLGTHNDLSCLQRVLELLLSRASPDGSVSGRNTARILISITPSHLKFQHTFEMSTLHGATCRIKPAGSPSRPRGFRACALALDDRLIARQHQWYRC